MEGFLQTVALTCRPPPQRTAGLIKSQSPAIAVESAAYTLTRKQMRGEMVRITVTVEAHPFGMNVKLGDVPSVVHVEAGSAADAEGVRTGDVVTAVNGVPVSEDNWYDAYSSAELPITVTLETCRYAPSLLESNRGNTPLSCAAALPGNYLNDYDEFCCDVASLPYGLRIRDDGGGRACVLLVMENSLAEAAGVLMGDILVLVGNRTVSSDTWHSTLKHSDLPCGLVFLRRRNLISSSIVDIGLGLAEVEPRVLSEGNSGHGAVDALHREACTASIVDPEDFREDVSDASAADVVAARLAPSFGGQAEKFDEATSVFAAEVIDFTCDDDTTALLLQSATAADSPAALVHENTSRFVIGDMDHFAEEAIQELVVLQEIQQAQNARRQHGLDQRQLQLRQCERDCDLAQQAVDDLQVRMDRKALLWTDPNDAGLAPLESECSSFEQGGQDPDRVEMDALAQTLATKKKRREALLHDISMWISWMEQSGELAREHYTPFSRDNTLPCDLEESTF